MDGNGTTQMPAANVDLKWRVWAETKMVWRIILPTVIARVTSYSTVFVTRISISKLVIPHDIEGDSSFHIVQVDKASKRLNQWLLEPSTDNGEDPVPSS